MQPDLKDRTIAILVARGFEQVELVEPRRALEDAGATTRIVSPESGSVRAWDHTDWGREFDVDVPIDRADADDYDALLLPGGVMNPDRLRQDAKAVAFTRRFFEQGKPVGAICHAPWTLIEAGVVEGRTLTSYPSLRTDLRNAGAEWVDREVVRDRGLVTSRGPRDLEAFNHELVSTIAAARHRERPAA